MDVKTAAALLRAVVVAVAVAVVVVVAVAWRWGKQWW
jgi:hypothetical protein